MIDTLMIDRETKYTNMFRGDVLTNADLKTPEELTDNEDLRTNKKMKQAMEALADYDSDEERENANIMFINDLQNLRKYFIKIITQQIHIQDEMQGKFNSEREFFLECTQKGQNNEDDLKNTIFQLQKEIEDERQYSMHTWADEQVSLICQKALFTYKYHQKSQHCKIEGLDTRLKPEGHFIVSKEEQDDAFGIINKGDQTRKSKNSVKIRDSQPPTLEKEKEQDEAKQTQKEEIYGDNSSECEKMSEISFIPTPALEKHMMEVENLKWQIDYERKLQQQMNKMLEDKVSILMANKDENTK